MTSRFTRAFSPPAQSPHGHVMQPTVVGGVAFALAAECNVAIDRPGPSRQDEAAGYASASASRLSTLARTPATRAFASSSEAALALIRTCTWSSAIR